MRVVIAPFNRMQSSTLEAVRAAGHEVICTGQEVTSYAEVAAQFPAGWKPDVFLFWSLEYYPIPCGIEAADCFTVGVVGDWNLGGQAVQQMGGAFDLLIADANGRDRLRGLGFANVETTALWSFDPALHRRLPDVRRDLDIVMIGNFNHDIQRERAKWLARVARLSARWRVCLTSGVQGAAYTELMNRAKIVFNRSIRGEINMRAYEAPACGALHFYERENREIGSLYSDRREVVLYGEDDLENLLEYYLIHDAEREQIAEAGWKRVQAETPSEHIRRLFEIIESNLNAYRNISSRQQLEQAQALPIENQKSKIESVTELGRARQWLLTSDRRFVPEVELALNRAEQFGAEPATIAKLRGVLAAQEGEHRTDSERCNLWRRAVEQWRTALSFEPESAAAHLNIARILLASGDGDGSEQNALQAYRLLKDRQFTPFAPGDLHWPRRYEAFEVELERIEGAFREGTPEWSSAMRGLLLWRVCEMLSDLAFHRRCFGTAKEFACEAVAHWDETGETHLRVARATRALGQVDEAVRAYRSAIDRAPFLVEARYELAGLLIDIERPVEALDILEQWRRIIAGCPVYRTCAPECEGLFLMARRAEQALNTQNTRLRRLLAFPDWQRPEHWQGIVRAFVDRPDQTPALLMLWADPMQYPDTGRLLREIETYLTVTLRIPASALPDITLMAQPLPSEDRWKLFYIADVIVGDDPPPIEFLESFRASKLAG